MIYEIFVIIFSYFHLPIWLKAPTWQLIRAGFWFALIVTFVMFAVLVLVLAERKILAKFTVRKGPNRVGYNGFLQTVADAIKLLFKEDIIPKNANKFLFSLAPVVFFLPCLVILSIIPFSSDFIALKADCGLLLLLGFGAISMLGIVIAGCASNNKYALIGAMRAVAQSISYELPMLTAAISVVVLNNSMNLTKIAQNQNNILEWNVFPSFIGFFVFLVCSIAELNRTPFDLPEAESELVSGYNVEYSGMKFALFFLAEYACLFVYSALIVTLFFGGFSSPFGVYLLSFLPIFKHFVFLEQIFWLILKTSAIIFLIMWIRATFPRLRADQLMDFCWKFLYPISVINLIFVLIYKYYLG